MTWYFDAVISQVEPSDGRAARKAAAVTRSAAIAGSAATTTSAVTKSAGSDRTVAPTRTPAVTRSAVATSAAVTKTAVATSVAVTKRVVAGETASVTRRTVDSKTVDIPVSEDAPIPVTDPVDSTPADDFEIDDLANAQQEDSPFTPRRKIAAGAAAVAVIAGGLVLTGSSANRHAPRAVPQPAAMSGIKPTQSSAAEMSDWRKIGAPVSEFRPVAPAQVQSGRPAARNPRPSQRGNVFPNPIPGLPPIRLPRGLPPIRLP